MKHLFFGGAGAVGTSLAMCLSRMGHPVGVYVRPGTRDKIVLGSSSVAPALLVYDLGPRGAKHRLFILITFTTLFVASCFYFSWYTCLILIVPLVYFALCLSRSLLPLVPLSTVPLATIATSTSEAVAFAPDIIWLTVSSNQLGSPDIAAFVTTTMSLLPRARLICLASAPTSLALVRTLLPPADARRLASATASLCAYQAPLKGEAYPVTAPLPARARAYASPPGALPPVAVQFIPGSSVILTPALAEQARDPVLKALAAELAATAAGGTIEVPTAETALVRAFTSMLVTFTTLTVAREGWSVTAAAGPEAAQRCAAAVEQAVPLVVLKTDPTATEATASASAKWAWLIVRAWLWMSAFLFPLLLPMDVSAFYAAHYRKVWAQFRDTARALASEGKAKGYPVGAIEKLVHGVVGTQTVQGALGGKETGETNGGKTMGGLGTTSGGTASGLSSPSNSPQKTSSPSSPYCSPRAEARRDVLVVQERREAQEGKMQ